MTFGTLYVLIFLSLDRRKVIHFNVTDAPSALWTSLQLIQAFPFDTAPRFIVRDRDSIYGAVVTATPAATQNPPPVATSKSSTWPELNLV